MHAIWVLRPFIFMEILSIGIGFVLGFLVAFVLIMHIDTQVANELQRLQRLRRTKPVFR